MEVLRISSAIRLVESVSLNIIIAILQPLLEGVESVGMAGTLSRNSTRRLEEICQWYNCPGISARGGHHSDGASHCKSQGDS